MGRGERKNRGCLRTSSILVRGWRRSSCGSRLASSVACTTCRVVDVFLYMCRPRSVCGMLPGPFFVTRTPSGAPCEVFVLRTICPGVERTCRIGSECRYLSRRDSCHKYFPITPGEHLLRLRSIDPQLLGEDGYQRHSSSVVRS